MADSPHVGCPLKTPERWDELSKFVYIPVWE